MAATRTPAVDLDLLEMSLGEAAEAYEEMLALHKKLKRMRRGSEAYLDLLPQIGVCASVIVAKTQSILREIDDIEDSLPDE
jgi:hypothetical protein